METTDIIVRVCGVLGCCGSVLVTVADWMGWTRPMTHEHANVDMSGLRSPLSSMIARTGLGVPSDRRRMASVLGGLAMFPCALGFIPMYALLAPANALLALLSTSLCAAGIVYGVMAHTMLGYIDEIKQKRAAASSEAGKAVLTDLTQLAIDYWTPFALSGVVLGTTAGSLLYSIMVAFMDTALPPAMAAANLALLMTLTRNSDRVLPFAVSRWLKPAHVHILAHAPFFAACTYFAWEGV